LFTWCLISLVQFTLSPCEKSFHDFPVHVFYSNRDTLQWGHTYNPLTNRFWNYEECILHRVLIFNIKKWKPVKDSKYSVILGNVSKLLTSQSGITSQEVWIFYNTGVKTSNPVSFVLVPGRLWNVKMQLEIHKTVCYQQPTTAKTQHK